jgi:hypothetical protein
MLASQSKGNLAYDNEGFEVYASFFDEVEPQLTPDIGELSFMADWAGKLHGNMTRFAGLIHCINAFEQGSNPLDTAINADEAHAAAELARYYLAHARAVYTEQAESESVTHARYLWGKILSMKTDKKNELTRMTQGKQDFVLDESLAELIERGYVRVEQTQTGGRPSPRIVVNPEARKTLTKVMKVSDDTPFVTFINKITVPANVPSTTAAADFSQWVELSEEEAADLPF